MTECVSEWKQRAIAMNDGNTSWREIARRLGLPKSSVSDFLRKTVGTPPVEIPRPLICLSRAAEGVS